MANKTLKALVNTVIKTLPQDSSTLSDSQKLSLAQNETIQIKQYRSSSNTHWEIELESSHNGISTWFAFISHVEIFSDSNFKQNLINTTIQEWNFFGQGTKKETENGFWQRVVKYWNEALDITHIDTPAEVGSPDNPWSAAFISWVMKEAGAGDKFKRDASHSVYIRDAIKKRKSQTVNASFIAFKIDEVTPEVGDLVCAPRASDVGRVTYDTTDAYQSHCDLVVEKKVGEIDVIGGNVSNSVTKNTLQLDGQGKVNDTSRPWFVVIKNLL